MGGNGLGGEALLGNMLELEVVPEHGLQGEAIEFLLGEIEIGEKPQNCPQLVVHFYHPHFNFDIMPCKNGKFT